jgi:hypothetical protein
VLPYIASPDPRLGVVAVLGAGVVVALHELARRSVRSWPALVVWATLLVGVGLQLAAHALYPYALGDLVVSDVATGFFGAAKRYPPVELLRDFAHVWSVLPLHAAVNMPGKILFFHALRMATLDPGREAVVIVALSSLAGVVLHAAVTTVFEDRRIGLDALVLWLIVPAKLGLYPHLNVVSPLPAVAAVWCMLRGLVGRRIGWSAAAGVFAYATAFFDPLALWLAVALAPLLVAAVATRGVRVREATLLCAVAAGSLVATHAVVRAVFGFDVVARLIEMVDFVRGFNAHWMRSRDVWVVANLREMALAAGPAMSLALIIASVAALARALAAIRHGPRVALRYALEPGPATAVTTVAVLAILDAICLNRGETGRLWLFLTMPAALAVAAWTAERPSARRLLVACTVGYAVLIVGTVGYCVPS